MVRPRSFTSNRSGFPYFLLAGAVLVILLGKPRIEVGRIAPGQNIFGDVQWRMRSQGQRNSVAGSRVHRPFDSVVFEMDRRIVRAVLDVADDDAADLHVQMLHKTFDQVMAHRSRCQRRVERELDGMALGRADPNGEAVGASVLTGEHQDFGIGVCLVQHAIDFIGDESLLGRGVRLTHYESSFPKSSGFKFSSHCSSSSELCLLSTVSFAKTGAFDLSAKAIASLGRASTVYSESSYIRWIFAK